jgi:hypothetical protein
MIKKGLRNKKEGRGEVEGRERRGKDEGDESLPIKADTSVQRMR